MTSYAGRHTPLHQADPYARTASARVLHHTEEGGIVLDTALFYTTGGGQPGDSGWLISEAGSLTIATTLKGPDGATILVPAEHGPVPAVGAEVEARLDWDRRYIHMRMHTALHLLSVVLPLPVTGGSIGAGRGRLDFLMPTPPGDKDALEAALNQLIDRDLAVQTRWITEAELDATPSLVKTLSVTPPRGSGHVRLVQIGTGADQVDLQPCGGTHVARTSEIGRVTLGKIENKGKQNRRVNIALTL